MATVAADCCGRGWTKAATESRHCVDAALGFSIRDADGEDRMKPKRIQRKRTKGWRMPEGAVYVGRSTQWGNPFESAVLGQEGAVDAFKVHLVSYFGWEARSVARAFYPWPVESTALRDWIAPLRGKDLACWCPLDQPCHADVLLELANGPVGLANGVFSPETAA
jgi:hypothetical protein